MKKFISKTSWFFGVAFSALLVLGFPFSVKAVDLISVASVNLTQANPLHQIDVNASDHENLNLSFDFNAEELDATTVQDSFEYGWKIGEFKTTLGTFDGQVGVTTEEVGSVSVPLPVEAQSGELVIYFEVTVNSATGDTLVLTNIILSGSEVIQTPSVVIGETGYDSLADAITAAEVGDIIELNEDITTPAQVTVNKSVTIDGKGHTLFAPFAKTDNDNNSAIGIVGVNGAVVIQNLTIDGAGSSGSRHGINVYESNGVTLDNVTLVKNNAAGLIVNSSTITANNLSTNGNGWYGVNVDKNATGDAVFTLTGSGVIAESVQIITDKTVGAVVTADGYDAYTINGTTKTLWTNKPLVNAVTIEGVNVIYSTIALAITASVPGNTVTIGAGTYAETATVSKSLTLVGAGESTILSGVVVGANDVTLRDLKIEKTGSGDAIQVTGASVENLTIDGVIATGANTGLKVSNTTSLMGLDVSGSSFDGNTFGWYFSHHPNTGTTVTDVTVSDSSFNNNKQKGIYVEKLNNAVFDGITVSNSGTDASYGFNNGIDINLKWAAYGDITIRNAEITGSGLMGTATLFDPAGIAIKGRDDGAYATPVAALSGVTLENVTVSGGVVGIRLGEEGKNNAGPSGVTISNSSLSGTGGFGLVNATQSSVTATENWWGTSDALEVPEKISGTATFSPWCSNASCTATSTGTEIQAVIADDVEEILATGAGSVTMEIPAGTVVTGPANWNGIVSTPVIVETTVQPTASSNLNVLVIQSIEVGAGDSALTFDTPVKLLFAGQENARVGWSRNGVFTEITDICNSATTPTLADGADCKIASSGDLIVWTKHFTTFTTYTTSARTSSGGSSGGRASPVASVVVPSVVNTTPAGQVLGETTFRFATTLRRSRTFNASVTELQKRLLAEGMNPGPLDGLFGPKTLSAVKAFQTARGLVADGIVGPLTNAELNKAPVVALQQ